MAEPSILSTGIFFLNDSSETSQTSRSAKLQQPIILLEYPFGKPVEFHWPLSNAWFGFGVGENSPPLTLGSPFLAAIISPSPRSLLQDLTMDLDMDSSGPNGSEDIPVFDEEYQLFLENIHQEPTQSSQSVSLPTGYRSFGQIIAGITSMGTSTPSRGLVLPSLRMSSMSLVSSMPFVMSISTRPTVCVASSAPVVTAQSSGVSTSVETLIAMAIPDGFSFEEYHLAI